MERPLIRLGGNPASLPGAVLDAERAAAKVPWWRPRKKRVVYDRTYRWSAEGRWESVLKNDEDLEELLGL